MARSNPGCTTTPGGKTRNSSGTTPTDHKYTGQIEEATVGLYFYNARYYDPSLGRFIQADTIIPQPDSPLAWDRYAYTNSNPIRYIDPSGHDTCDEEGNCYNNRGWYPAAGAHFSVVDTWKKMIRTNFGITMSDSGDKKWNTTNLQLMHSSLNNVDNVFNGNLRSIVAGATFKWMEYHGKKQYFSTTHTNGLTGIDFQTIGDQTIWQMNIYHEVGHLIDNVPGTKGVFTNAVDRLENPSWVKDNGYINVEFLISGRVYDPNYITAGAIQASEAKNWEVWADAFANYVAGNINLKEYAGRGMYYFVTDILSPYTGRP